MVLPITSYITSKFTKLGDKDKVLKKGLRKLALGLYSPTLLKNNLCLFLQDLRIGMLYNIQRNLENKTKNVLQNGW